MSVYYLLLDLPLQVSVSYELLFRVVSSLTLYTTYHEYRRRNRLHDVALQFRGPRSISV